MKARIQMALAMVALAGQIGCGSAVKQDDTVSEPKAPELAGNYLSACTPAPQADGSTSYFSLDFDLTESEWGLDYVVFADAECATPALTVRIEGPYALTAPAAEVEGAWEGTFSFTRKTMTPHVEFMADVLGSIEGCGAGEWEAGTTQDVSQTGCAAFGQLPIAECGADYDLVSLSDAGLTFGARPADNDMCEPGKRPTELSPLVSARVTQ